MKTSLPLSLLAATVLTGCASVAIDQNFAEVERFAREQAGSEVRWLRSDSEREAMRAEVDRLLAQPLTIDDAVRRIGRFTDRLHARLKRGDTRCRWPRLRLIRRLCDSRAAIHDPKQCDDRQQPAKTMQSVFHDRSPIGYKLVLW